MDNYRRPHPGFLDMEEDWGVDQVGEWFPMDDFDEDDDLESQLKDLFGDEMVKVHLPLCFLFQILIDIFFQVLLPSMGPQTA